MDATLKPASGPKWTVHCPLPRVSQPLWWVVSDDLTGMQAIAGEFARLGFRVGTAISGLPATHDFEGFEIFGYDTATRPLSGDEAEGRVESAVRHLMKAGAARIFKHNDSILQGHIGIELRIIARLNPGRPIVYSPACPNRGRVTLDGIQLEVDADGNSPQGGLRVDLAECVSRAKGITTRHLGLSVLRGAGAVEAIASARCDVLIVDASCDRDLDLLVEAAEGASCKVLAGSVGLAAAIARSTALRRRRRDPLLVIAGSLQRATRDQTERLVARSDCHGIELQFETQGATPESLIEDALRQASDALSKGLHCVVWSAPPEGAALDVLPYPMLSPHALARLRAHLLTFLQKVAADARLPIGGLVVAGGSTADLALRDALGVSRFSNLGWLCEGMTMAITRDGQRAGLPVVTKSGGWGAPDALCDAIDRLTAWRCTQPESPNQASSAT